MSHAKFRCVLTTAHTQSCPSAILSLEGTLTVRECTLVPDRTQLLARGWQFLPACSFWGYRSLLLTNHEALSAWDPGCHLSRLSS